MKMVHFASSSSPPRFDANITTSPLSISAPHTLQPSTSQIIQGIDISVTASLSLDFPIPTVRTTSTLLATNPHNGISPHHITTLSLRSTSIGPAATGSQLCHRRPNIQAGRINDVVTTSNPTEQDLHNSRACQRQRLEDEDLSYIPLVTGTASRKAKDAVVYPGPEQDWAHGVGRPD